MWSRTISVVGLLETNDDEFIPNTFSCIRFALCSPVHIQHLLHIGWAACNVSVLCGLCVYAHSRLLLHASLHWRRHTIMLVCIAQHVCCIFSYRFNNLLRLFVKRTRARFCRRPEARCSQDARATASAINGRKFLAPKPLCEIRCVYASVFCILFTSLAQCIV